MIDLSINRCAAISILHMHWLHVKHLHTYFFKCSRALCWSKWMFNRKTSLILTPKWIKTYIDSGGHINLINMQKCTNNMRTVTLYWAKSYFFLIFNSSIISKVINDYISVACWSLPWMHTVRFVCTYLTAVLI